MATPLEQTLLSKYSQAKDAFADGWKVGTFAWLQQNAIGMTVTLTMAENALDSAWLAAKKNPSRLGDFDSALNRWKHAHIDAMQEFRNRSGQ